MSGHRNFKELVAKMSPERRARIQAEADELHREYVLSQIRQQVGFTQADVAERLGVSQPTYAECERGNNMRIGTLQKIVAAPYRCGRAGRVTLPVWPCGAEADTGV